MLIVEGPDGVGKTTLCQKLLSRLPGHIYAHFTRLPVDFDWYWGYIDRMSQKVVQDRFHLSELMYSVPNGRMLRPTPEYYRLVDARLRQLGGMVVLVTANLSLIEARWDPAQMYNKEKTLAAAERYNTYKGWAAREGYAVDIDIHFHCDEAAPYVTDYAVDEIIGRYQRRQFLVKELARSRPAHL